MTQQKSNSSASKRKNAINASSMADIAFLLLVFFLVTTEINADEGIGVTLPPISEEEPDTPPINARNLFNVLLNADDELMVEGKETDLAELRSLTREFIANNGRNPKLSDSPRKAVVSYKGDRGTSYEHYLAVYNELIGAYKDLRNEMTAQATRGRVKLFAQLDRSTADSTVYAEVKYAYPIRLSEAEPTNFASK